ncbi:MAG: ferric reductase-like transmembrane domain-containing protein, partial [Xanthobacteraceae bacterium]|nr:ferric reductase-like transmembrane domain-containing protein [Xanthobacteraceae bacterium]
MPTPRGFRYEKTTAAALASAPAVWLAYLAYHGDLGARPVTEAIRISGDWTLRLLWLVLLIGPARRIFGLARLIRGRRILGIGVFGLAALHLALYALDLQLDWLEVARETVLRLYLTVGAVALVGLAALAGTSSDHSVAWIGSARWNRLHSAIYVIAALSLLHFLLRSRTDTFEPMLMLGLLIWLIGYRAIHRLAGDVTPGALFGLALASAVATASAEASWHAALTGLDPRRLLAAHLDVANGLRPAAWVLVAGLAAAAAGAHWGSSLTRRSPARPLRTRRPGSR